MEIGLSKRPRAGRFHQLKYAMPRRNPDPSIAILKQGIYKSTRLRFVWAIYGEHRSSGIVLRVELRDSSVRRDPVIPLPGFEEVSHNPIRQALFGPIVGETVPIE